MIKVKNSTIIYFFYKISVIEFLYRQQSHSRQNYISQENSINFSSNFEDNFCLLY